MTQIILHQRGSGPPLLLLHAFPLNAAMWDLQSEVWAERAAVWAPDLPGFGASAEAPLCGSLDALAAVLVERLRGEGATKVTVVGCSMGGYLAFALIRVAPEFVSRLVLINSKASADSEEARAKRISMAERVEREGCAFLADEWHLGALSAVTLERKPAVVEQVRALVRQATPAGVVAAQKAMASRPDSTPLLSSIAFPTLVIHGLSDRYVSENEARSMAAKISGAEFLGVSDAGHLPNLEEPQTVVQAVDAFLEKRGR